MHKLCSRRILSVAEVMMVGGFSPVMLYFKGYCSCGRVAQLGERGVRNAEVEGSNPFASTKYYTFHFTPV